MDLVAAFGRRRERRFARSGELRRAPEPENAELTEDHDLCGWEILRGRFHLSYTMTDAAAAFAENIGTDAYAYVWEIFYRRSGSGETYRSIQTKPHEIYRRENEGSFIIFQLPTYEDGMTDISSSNGEPCDYDFVFVIREGNDASGKICAWIADTLPVTDTYDLYLRDAFEPGAAIHEHHNTVIPAVEATCSEHGLKEGNLILYNDECIATGRSDSYLASVKNAR